MLVIISPRSDREATAGTLFQFIVYRNKKGKTRDGLAQSIFDSTCKRELQNRINL